MITTAGIAMAMACTRPVASTAPAEATRGASAPVTPEPEPQVAATTPPCATDQGCTEDGPPSEPVAEALPQCAPVPEEALAVTGVIEGLRFTIPSSKGQIDPKSFERLDAIAEVLVRHPHVRLEIRAHEDSNTADQHRYMSARPTERQAEGVRQYLVKHGVAAERLTAQGYGETQPLASNDTKEGRALNRRVELVVIEPPECVDRDPPATI